MRAHGNARGTTRIAWILPGSVFLHLGLALFYLVLWVTLAREGAFWQADFTAYYTAGSIVRDGLGAQLYDLDLQARYQQQILAGHSFADGLLPYINPPHAALLFAPLSVLRRSSAFFVWGLGQLLLLIWLLRLLIQLARQWAAHERWSMISAVLAFPPLLFTFQLGTFSLLMLVCVLQLYVELKNAHDTRAGLWLAMGTLKPQAVLLPAVMLLGARRWRAAVSASLAVIVMVLFSSIVLGWRVWPDFVRVIGTASSLFGVYGIVPADMYNLKGALTLLLGNDQGPWINLSSMAALMIAAAATLWVSTVAARPNEPGFELPMALTILSGILFSPHSYPHDSVMLVAPTVLFYAYLRERDLPRRAYAAFVLCWPLLFLISECVIAESLRVRPPVVVMAVLGVWMSKYLVDELRARRVDG